MNLSELDTEIRTLVYKMLRNEVHRSYEDLKLVLLSLGKWASLAQQLEQKYPNGLSTALQDIKALCVIYEEGRANPGSLLDNAPVILSLIENFLQQSEAPATAREQAVRVDPVQPPVEAS